MSARRVASGPLPAAIFAAAIITSHSSERFWLPVPGLPDAHVLDPTAIKMGGVLIGLAYLMQGKHASVGHLLAGYGFGVAYFWAHAFGR